MSAICFATLLVAVSGSNLFADTNVGTVDYTLNNAITNQPTEGGVYAGPYTYNFLTSGYSDSGSNPIMPGTTVVGFCLDYTQDVTFSTTYSSNVWLLAPTSSGTGNISNLTNDPGIANLNAVDAKVVNAISYWVDVQKNTGGPTAWTGSPTSDSPAPSVPWASNWPSGRSLMVTARVLRCLPLADFGGGSPAITTTGVGNQAWTAINEANTILQYANNYSYSGGPQVYAIVDTGDQIQGLEFGGGQTGQASPTPEPAGLVALAGLGIPALPVGARKWRLWRESREVIRQRQRLQSSLPTNNQAGCQRTPRFFLFFRRRRNNPEIAQSRYREADCTSFARGLYTVLPTQWRFLFLSCP